MMSLSFPHPFILAPFCGLCLWLWCHPVFLSLPLLWSRVTGHLLFPAPRTFPLHFQRRMMSFCLEALCSGLLVFFP